MARHYSTKDLFRQMPNVLLARYFESHNLFSDLDFTAMRETRPDELFARWLALPDAKRNALDAELREIHEMSCEKGFRAVIDEAEFHLAGDQARASLVERLAKLSSHAERAMIAFLDHRQLWPGATRFYHADSLPYWRKRKNLPRKPACVDDASLRELERLLSQYFHATEGRGRNCFVEPLRRRDLDYYFCYPEDYSQHEVEWVDGQFARRPHNPAFEVIYVYSRSEGSLDLNFQGSYKAVEPLQQMFAEAILKMPELPPDPADERVYDLNPFCTGNFEFTYEPNSGIQDVAVRKLRLSSVGRKGERLTLEGDGRTSVYELLGRLEHALPLRLYKVTQVELVATVTLDPTKPPKKIPIRITHPNSCSLKYDPTDLKLREMLHASGVEPRKQVGPVEEPIGAPHDSSIRAG
jgi:hypothetical protein